MYVTSHGILVAVPSRMILAEAQCHIASLLPEAAAAMWPRASATLLPARWLHVAAPVALALHGPGQGRWLGVDRCHSRC